MATLDDLLAQRDAIRANMGVARTQYQGREIEYPVGDARLKELAYLEDQIQKLTAQQAGKSASRSTYASHRRD